MEVNAFYNTAKIYAESIKYQKPNYFTEPGSTLCLILTDTQEIFSGVTSVRIHDGVVDELHSEHIAIMSMLAANKVRVQKMLTISFDDFSICIPTLECLNMLFRADSRNRKCEVVVSLTETVPAEELTSGAYVQKNASDNNSNPSDFVYDDNIPQMFDDEPVYESNNDESSSDEASSLGAPADFVSGFEFDESNPFYEPDAPDTTDNVEALNPDGHSTEFLYTPPQQSNSVGSESYESNSVYKGSEYITETDDNKKISKKELLKQAKERKKAAKSNARFKKLF